MLNLGSQSDLKIIWTFLHETYNQGDATGSYNSFLMQYTDFKGEEKAPEAVRLVSSWLLGSLESQKHLHYAEKAGHVE